MKTTFRPWYSEASRRWHCPKTGRFLAFSDARPRGGVFEVPEADLDFEMFNVTGEVAPAKARELERQRAGYHRRRNRGMGSNTVTGRRVA
jgi:hypothetical protein